MTAAMRQFRHDRLGLSGGLEVAGAVREANDAVGIGDIQPLRIGASRKKRNTERAIETAGTDLVRVGL
jgi:hypothetical protein